MLCIKKGIEEVMKCFGIGVRVMGVDSEVVESFLQ